ncbi:MAG: hypothetical protein IJ774_08490 [Selenomonadaceae bacterium]|nr:hypothetical protein [Selenomonadaceae bacterium]
MRGVKDEYRLMDFVFRNESDQTQPVKDFIAVTYSMSGIRAECRELAARRYRKGEHRFKTCWEMHISEPQYYKLLGKFLSTAKAVHEKFFAAK